MSSPNRWCPLGLVLLLGWAFENNMQLFRLLWVVNALCTISHRKILHPQLILRHFFELCHSCAWCNLTESPLEVAKSGLHKLSVRHMWPFFKGQWHFILSWYWWGNLFYSNTMTNASLQTCLRHGIDLPNILKVRRKVPHFYLVSLVLVVTGSQWHTQFYEV